MIFALIIYPNLIASFENNLTISKLLLNELLIIHWNMPQVNETSNHSNGKIIFKNIINSYILAANITQ